MAQLIVQVEGGTPVVHELTDDAITIGRETDNTIVIVDASVSRHHAEIPASDGPRTLRDLNSANGTAVNGVPITEKLLKPGDSIHFGVTQATFVTRSPAKAKAPAPAPAVPSRPPAPVDIKLSPGPVKTPPLATAQEPLPAPPVPSVPAPAPAVEPPRPAVAKMPPPVPPATPSAGKAPLPAAQAPLPDEKASLPAAKLPVPVVPVAPPPILAKMQPLVPVPVETPSAPVAVLPPAVAKTPLPAPAKSPVPPPAPLSPAAKTPLPVAAKLPSLPVAKVPPPVAAKPPSTPAAKHWRPDPPAAKERIPKPDGLKDSSPLSAAAAELPLVPADLGRSSSGSVGGKPLPAFIGVKEREYAPDDSPSFFARHRLLFAGLAVLVAAAVAAAFLLDHPSPPAKLPAASKPVAARDNSTPAETKRFWDQIQEITRAGLKEAQSVPFQQYPLMSSGMYDFQLIDDNDLDALMNSLTARSRGLSHVSDELALIDKTNVDADLVAFGKKLTAHWERAASLDSDAMNVVWAVHGRRVRPAATATPALESADVVPTEIHAPGATPVTMDHVTKLANDWLAQRNEFVKVGREVDASEKEIYRQMASRYKDQFK